jgi:hypothetical protein
MFPTCEEEMEKEIHQATLYAMKCKRYPILSRPELAPLSTHIQPSTPPMFTVEWLQVDGSFIHPPSRATVETLDWIEHALAYLIRTDGIQEEESNRKTIILALEQDGTLSPVLGVLFTSFESRWNEMILSCIKLQTLMDVYHALLKNRGLNLVDHRERIRNMILSCIVCHPLGNRGEESMWIRKQAAYLLHTYLYRFPEDRNGLYMVLLQGMETPEVRLPCLFGLASIGCLHRVETQISEEEASVIQMSLQ